MVQKGMSMIYMYHIGRLGKPEKVICIAWAKISEGKEINSEHQKVVKRKMGSNGEKEDVKDLHISYGKTRKKNVCHL